MQGLGINISVKPQTFDEHIAVNKMQQFADKTIFKNTAGVVAEMIIDQQMNNYLTQSMHTAYEMYAKKEGGHSGRGHSGKHLLITVSPTIGRASIDSNKFKGKATIPVVNCWPTEIVITRGTNNICRWCTPGRKSCSGGHLMQTGVTLPQHHQILQELSLAVPVNEKKEYIALILKTMTFSVKHRMI